LFCTAFENKANWEEAKMLTAEERALVIDMGDRLLGLYAQRDEAVHDGNLDRIHKLQSEIQQTSAERLALLHSQEARS
jgi:hypothetical protein